MRKSTGLLVVFTAAVAFWLWYQWGGSAESRIRRQIGELEATLEKEKGEGPLVAVGKANQLEQLFAPTFVAEVLPLAAEVRDLRELQRLFVGTRQQAETIQVVFQDQHIEVKGGRASCELTAHFNGLAGALGARESFRVFFELREEGGVWRITRVRVVDVEIAL